MVAVVGRDGTAVLDRSRCRGSSGCSRWSSLTLRTGVGRRSVQGRVGRTGGDPGQLAGLAAQHPRPQPVGVGAEQVGGRRRARRTRSPPRSRRRAAPAPQPAYPAKIRSPVERWRRASSVGVSRSTMPTSSYEPRGSRPARRRARRRVSDAPTASAESVLDRPAVEEHVGLGRRRRPSRQHVADRHRRGPVEHHAEGAVLVDVEQQHDACARSSGRAAPGWRPAAGRPARSSRSYECRRAPRLHRDTRSRVPGAPRIRRPGPP